MDKQGWGETGLRWELQSSCTKIRQRALLREKPQEQIEINAALWERLLPFLQMGCVKPKLFFQLILLLFFLLFYFLKIYKRYICEENWVSIIGNMSFF